MTRAKICGVATVPLLLRGRLLVATPPLVDPNFDRLGGVAARARRRRRARHRPQPAERHRARHVLPEWHEHATAPGVVFIGGPVAPEAVIALARGGRDDTEGWMPVLGEVGTVDVGRDPADSAAGSTRCACSSATRVGRRANSRSSSNRTRGSSFPPSRAIRSRPDPEQLWREVLRRQRGRVAMFANYPEDPETN